MNANQRRLIEELIAIEENLRVARAKQISVITRYAEVCGLDPDALIGTLIDCEYWGDEESIAYIQEQRPGIARTAS